MHVQERYAPRPVGANETISLTGASVGGFLCTTAGTVTLVRDDGQGNTTTLVNAMAVAAGTYYPMPFYLGSNGGTFTTAGGAIGCLGVV